MKQAGSYGFLGMLVPDCLHCFVNLLIGILLGTGGRSSCFRHGGRGTAGLVSTTISLRHVVKVTCRKTARKRMTATTKGTEPKGMDMFRKRGREQTLGRQGPTQDFWQPHLSRNGLEPKWLWSVVYRFMFVCIACSLPF